MTNYFLNQINSRYPQRILFYRIGQIGDTVNALPAVWAIRRQFPRAFITLLNDQHGHSNYTLALRTLPEKGLFDDFIFYNAHKDGTPFWNLLRLIPQIRQGQFDTLVYLAPRFRTRRQVWRDLAFFRLTGIKRFIGHKGTLTLSTFKANKPWPYLDKEPDHLLSRLAFSGIPVPAPGQGCMDLLLTQEEKDTARDWLLDHIELDKYQILIGVGVGGKCATQIWPRERFARLGRRIIEKIGGVPIVFGGPEDRYFGESLIKEWGAGANAAGELNVRQAAAALSFCRLYVGNDTGTMHLAAAVGTQCIAIFSARNFPGEWHPYGPNHIVLKANVACEACKLSECLKYDLACLKLISVGDVINACERALNNKEILHENESILTLDG
jgi:lipopolysaccharide heptosyltransferase III